MNSNSGNGRIVAETDHGVEHVDRENKIESDGSITLTSYKKLKSNEGREAIGLTQHEENHSYEENATKKAFQDGDILISNVMLKYRVKKVVSEKNMKQVEMDPEMESRLP